MACPAGACRIGEQKAGWPFPVFVDAGGSSPVGGWGMLGPEDLPLPGALILDVLFYSLLLWLALYILHLIRRRALPLKLIVVTLPFNIFLAVSLWFFYMLFANYAPIGRGHMTGIYMDTPTDTFAVERFSPIVSIPLDELVEIYGELDDVWLSPDGSSKVPTTQMVLYWDSIGMFVELPEIANKSYVVKKTTNVVMIIFFNEGQVLRIAGKPLGTEKVHWNGYGAYEP
jgi:hypothetical protein